MPKSSTSVAGRRSSLRSAATVPASNEDASRRALGDVSNKRQAKSKANGRKPTVERAQNPRRSRRLSEEPTEVTNPAEDETEHTKSLRASTKARSRESEEKAAERLVRSSERGRSSSRNPARRASSSRSRATSAGKAETSKTQKGSSNKRSREEREEEPKKKAPRGSSRQPSKKKGTANPTQQRRTRSKSRPKTVCKDILPHTDYGLVREPFDSSQYTSGIASYDAEKTGDVLEVSNYVTDIFQRLYNEENLTRPQPYMSKQPTLNSMMRAILVDWLVEVHMKFRLIPETLYLCVNIIDRYLSQVEVERQKLQLVGVTALLVACKYEEIYPPEVKDCVYITDRAYTRQEVLDMEAHIVKELEFRFTVPTAYPFLKRFLHVTKASKTVTYLASYYMERMLQEYSTLSHRPSLLAAAAVCLALNNPDALECEVDEADGPPGLPESLLAYTGFTLQEIEEASILIAEKVNEETTTFSRRNLTSVKRKYEADRYENVSRIFMYPDVNHLR